MLNIQLWTLVIRATLIQHRAVNSFKGLIKYKSMSENTIPYRFRFHIKSILVQIYIGLIYSSDPNWLYYRFNRVKLDYGSGYFRFSLTSSRVILGSNWLRIGYIIFRVVHLVILWILVSKLIQQDQTYFS